ncbi:hypothetical protein K438DRAFT_1455827, partial [Mycena galopus ATCC 62051]
MGTKNRPHQVSMWIGRGRKWAAPPCLDMEKWVVTWQKWWGGIQPDGRVWEKDERSRPEEADWSDLASRYGKNGLLQVMVTLFWW